MTLFRQIERREKLVKVFVRLRAENRQQQFVLTVGRRLAADLRLLACSQNLSTSRSTQKSDKAHMQLGADQ